MLVVIGIIGILAGTLLGNYSGITARVRSAKCASNLKNLANAVSSYTVCGYYPYAQSAQYLHITGEASNDGLEIGEHRGWISWLSSGQRFPISGNSPRSISHCSFADTSQENVTYALTNGAIWTAVGKNRDCYRCPVHVEQCRKRGVNPGWSYQMNAYFGFESAAGQAEAMRDSRIYTHNIERADRILLFAEIPALDANGRGMGKYGVQLPQANLDGNNSDLSSYGCLLTKDTEGACGTKGQNGGSSGTASIGFNHVRGKEIVGHVAFADGHVETLAAPKNGDFVNLTDWLCRGCEVGIKNKNYEKTFDPDEVNK